MRKRNLWTGAVGVAVLSTLAGPSRAQIVFEQDFVQGQPSPNQCTAWQAFSAQLVPQDYTLLVMKGTNDPDGISCSDPDVIARIAANLNTNNQAREFFPCDGRTWATGGCGGGVELSAANSVCSCPNPEYIVRPCIGNANWGGVNTATCGGTTQTMIVEFHAGQQTTCHYKTKKFKQKKCVESGCPTKRVDECLVDSELPCEDVGQCGKKLDLSSGCTNPEEKGKCKHKLARCACQ